MMQAMSNACLSQRGRRRSFGHLPLLIILGLLAVLLLLSCRTTAPDDPLGNIYIQLDAVPLLVKADSASVSTIWATVLISNEPAPDSTAVQFVATMGSITPEAMTRDGLARAVFTPGTEPGAVAVVAQVLAVRDTVMLTVY